MAMQKQTPEMHGNGYPIPSKIQNRQTLHFHRKVNILKMTVQEYIDLIEPNTIIAVQFGQTDNIMLAKQVHLYTKPSPLTNMHIQNISMNVLDIADTHETELAIDEPYANLYVNDNLQLVYPILKIH